MHVGQITEDLRTVGHIQAKEIWRRFVAGISGPEVGLAIRIGISASFTIDPLLPMLGAALVNFGFRPSFGLADYNQIFQVCLDHEQHLGACDVIVVLWRMEDLLAKPFNEFILGRSRSLEGAKTAVDELTEALNHLVEAFPGTVVVSLPPYPQGTPSDLLELDNFVGAGEFHRAILDYFSQQVRTLSSVKVLDLDALQRQFGAKAAFDARKWSLYKQPYTEAFLWELGKLTARIIKARISAPKKCVVLDCDNTLWGGIIGEDGIGSIALGQDFPGSGFRDLQKYMLYLRSKGILLALASKNNEPDVWQVFDAHDDMVLKRQHISAWQINWETKSANLTKIAEELNIGTDSLVFIDDNPFETEQIQGSGVTVITLSPEPAKMVEDIRERRLFDKLELTSEDLSRADMIGMHREREKHLETVSKERFAATLGLRVKHGPATASQLGRIAQLVNKTNQFNLTTVRRSESEIKVLAGRQDWIVYAMSVEDKFGDYGLVSVAIVEKGDAEWRIDTFLMSCRVLGRGVETALLARIASDAEDSGAARIRASYIPTAKNAPAASFLRDHGFETASGDHFSIAVELIPRTPNYITVDVRSDCSDAS